MLSLGFARNAVKLREIPPRIAETDPFGEGGVISIYIYTCIYIYGPHLISWADILHFWHFLPSFIVKHAPILQPTNCGCKCVFLFSSFSLLLPFSALFFLFSSASIHLKASKLPTNWGVRHIYIYIYAFTSWWKHCRPAILRRAFDVRREISSASLHQHSLREWHGRWNWDLGALNFQVLAP